MTDESYVPRHRGARAESAASRGLTRVVVAAGLGVAATGLAFGGLLLVDSPGTSADNRAMSLSGASGSATTSGTTPRAEPTVDRDRSFTVSRSDRRSDVDAAKVEVLSQRSGGQLTRTEKLASGDPRDIARAMLAEFGFARDQFGCLDSLWMRESGWNPRAANPSSGAYGIPQSLPGSKMATVGPDWRYNPATQIRWGLGYIKNRYGTPCGAWGFFTSRNWY